MTENRMSNNAAAQRAADAHAGHCPTMIDVAGVSAPASPKSLSETSIDAHILADLVLKVAFTMPQFTTETAVGQLCLPMALVSELLEGLRTDKLLEVLGESGPLGYRFAITDRGRERARRLMEISGYVGPAPVSLGAYSAFLEWQFGQLPDVTHKRAADAISDLVLTDDAVRIAGLAVASGRSLFLHGPPGNGKTSVGQLLHNAIEGFLWVPYCIGIENSSIRIFDPQCHEREPLELSPEDNRQIDQRWVRVRRPFIVVGGELRLEDLDLGYSPDLRFYEAPMHLKANGGTFLIDDFSYQRVEPWQLLSRWVFPLEQHVDHLTLQTGQKIEVPFRQMLIVSTNLDPKKVMDPSFLRRMGYRLYLGSPSPERYAQIFERYAARYYDSVPSGLVKWLLDRYVAEGRSLNCCEPRELIERARDICQFENRPPDLNQETLDIAWKGYFGDHISTRK